MNFVLNSPSPELIEFFCFKNPSNGQKQQQYINALSPENVHEMLSFLDPDMSYEEWLTIGMALHSGGFGVHIWDEWSAKGNKYKQGECVKKWNGFSSSGSVSLGSLFHMAKQSGYRGSGSKEIKHTKELSFKNAYNDQPNHQYGFVSAGELTQNIRPPQWLINQYLEEHTLSCIFGKSGTGKSFISIDMACCIATGTSYHGYEVEQGAVFYIAGEGHNGIAKRLKAWEIRNDVSLESAPLFISKRPAQLCNLQNAQEVAHAVDELSRIHNQKPSLIVVDTLARNFGDGDENSTKEMNSFVNHIDFIKNEWNAAALIVHHSGLSDDGRARGSVALKGAMDHEYKVTKKGDFITLHSEKTKESEDPSDLNFKLVMTPVPHSEGNIPLKGAALVSIDQSSADTKGKLTPQQHKGFKILKASIHDKGKERLFSSDLKPIQSVTIEEFKEALKEGGIAKSNTTDAIRTAYKRIVGELVKQGLVIVSDDLIALLDNPDKMGQAEVTPPSIVDRQDNPL